MEKSLSPRLPRGFTLIEMSVVLVIIGLVIGGVVVGQSILRQSQVNTVITDVKKYTDAIATFRQKYGELPGDMADATGYWGTNANCATGGTGTGTQTCNGNGNGQIGDLSTAPYEAFLVWQHLANAGMIEGQFTGGGTNAYWCSPGVNCPGGQVSGAEAFSMEYWVAQSGANGGASPTYWAQAAGHMLIVGAASTPASTNFPGYGLFAGKEAASIDTKVDDGNPGTGTWKSTAAATGYDSACVVDGSNNPLTDGTTASAATAVYNQTQGSSNICSFMITTGF